MTNPSNAVGTNAAYGGRTSVNAFNDDLAIYSGRGVVSGWACAPDSGMGVVLGGDGTTRDVAVAEDDSGNRTTINNTSGAPVSVTIGAAPASNSRIDAIVAYVDNPPQGSSEITDNYEACGIISINGAASASPSAPTDSAIRSAITADGASGATAYYVVLATVRVASGTTTIVASNITQGASALIQGSNLEIPDESITADKIAPDAFSWGSQISGTNCTCRLAKIGKIGFLHVLTSQFSYPGTYASQQITIPAGTIPSGSTILQIQTSVLNQTVTGNQSARIVSSVPAVTSTNALEYGVEFSSQDAVAKSASAALLFTLILS